METKLSPFDILNVSESSTSDQIKDRYKLMSVTFHPDKQSRQTQHSAKQYFEKVSQAYASIQTDFRKYVFYKFGFDGIDLVQKFPEEFSLLDGKESTAEGRQQIDELILNMHFSERRDYLDDQGKVDSAFVLDISHNFQKHPEGLPTPSYPLPTIKRVFSNYALSAPAILDFQNSAIFEFASISSKPSVGMGLLSTRRIFNYFLLKNIVAYSPEGFFQSLSIQYSYSPTFSIKLVPLTLIGQNFARPKILFQKRLDSDISVSANTNGEQYNASIYLPGKTKESMNKSVELTFNQSLDIDIELDFYLSNFCRFVVRLNQAYYVTNNKFGISYGIVATLTENTKIHVISHIHQQNFLEIKISYGKYNLRIPIICESLDWQSFEILKFTTMLGFYVGSRMLHYYRRNSSMKKARLKASSFNRLNEFQSKLKVTIAETHLEEIQNLKFETLSKGLIILAAYVGNERQIHRIARKVKRKNLSFEANPVSRIRAELQFEAEEIINVTKLVQVLVKGARIEGRSLKVYNSCYDETESPFLYIYYNLRGSTKQIIQPADREINIGLPQKKRDNILTNALTWLRKVNVLW